MKRTITLAARGAVATACVASLLVGSAAASEAATATIDLTMTADSATVHAGDAIGFTVTVTNPTSTNASKVALSDALPADAGTAWSIDSQTAGACAIAGSSMDCSIGTLAPNAAYTVHLTSPTTDATASSSTVDNSATATSAKGASTTASASITVLAAPPKISTTTTAGPVASRPIIGNGFINCGVPWFTPGCWSLTFTAQVVAATGQPVGEGTVSFSGGDFGCVAPVDAAGFAQCTSPLSGHPATNSTATYSGSATFAPSSGSWALVP
jgi:uncharacterized repeat protein (TIGR01451 family)